MGLFIVRLVMLFPRETSANFFAAEGEADSGN
jgi:hypothetical protein